MPRHSLSRRGFLHASMAAMTFGAGLPAWFAREVIAEDEERARRRIGPDDEIRVGAIGTGSRGLELMTQMAEVRGVRIVAICDVDANHLNAASNQAEGRGAARYVDYRELLARSDVDAVTIATPDHWHAIIAVDAMKAGKDVYCEKPLTLTIDEGKVVRKAAAATGRVLQVGSQQRSIAPIRLACELVRNGRLGKLARVETRVGANPAHTPFRPSATPPGLDWDRWLGQAPAVPYIKERCYYDFRWWYEYAGGKVTDWGAHHNDVAQWGLGRDRSGPSTVEATSTPVGADPDAYNCPVDFTITYRYDDGIELVCTAKGNNGIMFVGEGGFIFVNRDGIRASDRKILAEPLPDGAVRLEASDSHFGNFFDCVRSRKPPICDAEVGHRSATVCHLGNIAIRTGERLTWDPTAERFVGGVAANAMLSRPMRPPYKLDA